MRADRGLALWSAVAALLALPALHPLLIPFIGVPSHLLWWVHVLPVALVTFRRGHRPGLAVFALSALLVLAGERLFGAGYGRPASWETAWALTIALAATNALVAGFAVYARRVARRYDLLFDNAASAILWTDAQDRVVAANPAARRLFDCDWQELQDRRFDEIPWLAHAPAPASLGVTGWSGPLTVDRAGDPSTVHVVMAAVAGEDPPGHQVLVVDRTTEILQERELDRQARLAALGEGLAGVAHELKNPLQVIGGYAELGLAPESSPEEMRESLETIARQSRRMQELVRELLGFSRERPESGPVALDTLVSRLIRMQQVAHGNAVRFTERLSWRQPVEVSAGRLEQIVSNLLSNAVDAVPAGSGHIEVELRGDADAVVIEVADNGPGIDPGMLDRIFQPFVTTKPEGVGTGLGLAICRRLAATMGATLKARNRPGGGAVFTLRLRLPRSPGQRAADPEAPAVVASTGGRR